MYVCAYVTLGGGTLGGGTGKQLIKKYCILKLTNFTLSKTIPFSMRTGDTSSSRTGKVTKVRVCSAAVGPIVVRVGEGIGAGFG